MFIYQTYPENTAYNIALPLQFSTQIHVEILQQAVQQLVARHSMLRTRFFELDGVPYQQPFSAEMAHDWQTIDANGWTEPELLEQVRQASQQPFILEQGVFRVTWFTRAKTDAVLLFTLHQIAGDATSLTILGRELLTLYAAL